MGLIPVLPKKPRVFIPGLIGPQVPRTSLLKDATRVTIVTTKLPGIQFHSYAIDPRYGKGKQKAKVRASKLAKIVIDWDNLRGVDSL